MKDEIVLLDHFSRITQAAEPYPVDFDLAWQWVGYARKDVALRTLQNNFEENSDYSALKRNRSDGKPGNLENLNIHNNEENQVSGKHGGKREGAGRPVIAYFLSVDCFKAFCMLAQTEKGKEVRQYYLAIEKKYRELLQKPAVFTQETLEKAVSEAVDRALNKTLAFAGAPRLRKQRDKADRLKEVRQEVAAFVEKQVIFTGNWRDVVKESEMYALFKAECIEKAPIPRYEFTNQFLRDYPAVKFGRNKQDVAIWHNIRLKD